MTKSRGEKERYLDIKSIFLPIRMFKIEISKKSLKNENKKYVLKVARPLCTPCKLQTCRC